MKGKVKYIIIGLIVLLVGLYLYLMDMEAISGSVIVINILNNESQSSLTEYGDKEYNLTPGKLDELTKNPNDYITIEYDFKLKNLSGWKKIYYVELRPIFPEKMQDMVFAYRKNRWDGLESPIFLDTNDTTMGSKRIIIKKQVIDEDFLQLIESVRLY